MMMRNQGLVSTEPLWPVSYTHLSYLVKDVFPMILGSQLKNAILSGSNNISKYKKQINELNIFPVPDGDTGTNMSMTITAAAEAMEALEDAAPAGEVAKRAASAMLRGARGNSGVKMCIRDRNKAEAEIGSAEQEAKRIVSDAIKSAEARKKEIVLEGKDELHRLRDESEKELNNRRKEIQHQERRVLQ